MKLKSILRALQSRAPFIRPVKFETYNLGTRVLGWPLEPEFKLLSRLPPARLALDIGGNWGQSIHALKRTARPARIVAFEPNPVLASRLERRFLADKSVTIMPCALSNTEGQFELHLPWYRGYLYDGLASLNYDEAREWFTAERFAWFDPSKLRIETIAVKTKLLDSLDLSPDVVKIDVQGAEEQVLQGGIGMFERCKPATIMECPTPGIVETMASVGLPAYFYHDGQLRDWKEHGNNVIFLTDDHRQKLGM